MSDPLVDILKRVREVHEVSQAWIEECMGLAEGTYRHIERGRRPLPDFRNGLVDWVRGFQDCVEASVEERQEIHSEMSRVMVEQLARLLEDIERAKKSRRGSNALKSKKKRGT